MYAAIEVIARRSSGSSATVPPCVSLQTNGGR